MAEIYIVQRQTLDWASLDLERFRAESVDFCRRLGKADDFVYQLARLWNSSFACDYFETRARIKAISEKHNSRIAGTRFIGHRRDHRVALDGAGYVFIDDDDWFSPDLGTVLLPHTGTERNFLLWRTTNIGSPNQATPVFYWGMNGRCMTNNYMVNGHWVRSQASVEKAYWHKSAIRTLGEEADLEQLDCCLSVANKGPISSMSLMRGLGTSRDSSALCDLLARYLDQMQTVGPSDLAHIDWAAPLLKATIRVYQDVYDSRIVR